MGSRKRKTMFKTINKNKLFTFIAVVGLLVFLYFIGLLKPVESFAAKIMNPVMSRFYSVGSSIRIKYDEQTSKIDLLQKVEDLEGQVVDLTKRNADLKKIEEENEILRGHLNFLTVNEYSYVMSNVISRGDVVNISDRIEVIVIDKGTNEGIYNGLVVVSSDGVVVGKIVNAREETSQVYLANNEECKIAVTTFNDDKTSGVTEGDMGLTVKMGYIPQDKNIMEGDIVVTSGLEQYIPRGLIVGQVKEVDKESTGLWQNAVIEPMVDLNNLIVVSVLLP